MSSNVKYHLFVYGTLKRGGGNHYYLRHGNFLGEYYTVPGYGLTVTTLPYLLEDEEGPGCWGELYEVDRFTLFDIDNLEGHPTWYKRKEISIINPENQHMVSAQAYIYQGEIKNATFIRRY